MIDSARRSGRRHRRSARIGDAVTGHELVVCRTDWQGRIRLAEQRRTAEDPATVTERLRQALRELGVGAGEVVLVHSDTNRVVRWLGGDLALGLATMLDALLDFLAPEGTLVVPTFSYRFCRGAAFDRDRTPSEVGLFTNALLRRPSAVRSDHPIFSFAGIGPMAEQLMTGVSGSGGRIINCTSIMARRGARGHVAYAASKAAVIGMSLAAAKELAPFGITVNVVAPGFIDTDMTADLSEDQRNEFVSAIPIGRPGTADEVARVVMFLAGDGGGYITGQVLGVDGGQVM